MNENRKIPFLCYVLAILMSLTGLLEILKVVSLNLDLPEEIFLILAYPALLWVKARSRNPHRYLACLPLFAVVTPVFVNPAIEYEKEIWFWFLAVPCLYLFSVLVIRARRVAKDIEKMNSEPVVPYNSGQSLRD